MITRIRSLWLAGGGAVALAVALSGVVAAATIMTTLSTPTTDPVAPIADTTATFEDLDGNGIDDDCQTDVVADAVAAASAEAAADLNRDGTISASEAAQSGRVGGKNCNHGGYVSLIAHGTEPAETADGETPVECAAAAPAASGGPVAGAVVVDLSPNAHGKAVSEVAKSDAVGGKNCNHGGAVSEAAKKDHAAAKSAREAAKASREAAREARRAAREAKRHGKSGS